MLPERVDTDTRDEKLHYWQGTDYFLELRVHPEYRSDRDIVAFYKLTPERWMSVTARGINPSGNSFLRNNKLNPLLQYGEIGPGFAGVFPNTDIQLQKTPIVIDPVSPKRLLQLTETVRDSILKDSNVQRILGYNTSRFYSRSLLRMKYNMLFYLSDRVRYFQKTFRQAMEEHSELHHCMDAPPFCSYSAEYYDYSATEIDGPSHDDLVRLVMKSKCA